MAKLNSEDYKGFDIAAKIVKGCIIIVVGMGSLVLGKAALGRKKDNDDDNNDDSGDNRA